MAESIWTRWQVLWIPEINNEASYCLPFFAHYDLGPLLFTNPAGDPLPVCADTLYKASDHQLLWISYPADAEQPPGGATVHLYWIREGDKRAEGTEHLWSDAVLLQAEASPFVCQADMFALAEYWASRPAHAAWDVVGTSAEKLGTRVSVAGPPSDMLALGSSDGPSPQGPAGAALRDSKLARAPMGLPLHLLASSTKPLCLTRRLPSVDSCGRLHLRARFYDCGTDQAFFWLTFASRLGQAAVGVVPAIKGFYAVIGDTQPLSNGHGTWQATGAARTQDWHVLELALQQEAQGSMLTILLDSQVVCQLQCTARCPSEEVSLKVMPGTEAYWAGIEVLHTPPGHETWEVGVMSVSAGNRRPWRVRSAKQGRWKTTAGQPGIEVLPVEEEAEAEEEEQAPPAAQEGGEEQEEELEEVGEECLHEASPHCCAGGESPESSTESESEGEAATPARSSVTARKPVRKKGRKRTKKSRPATPDAFEGLAVECWTKPDETAMQRLDRVMGDFLQKLCEAGVAMPSNIRRLGACEEPQHSNCALYSFGTRRLHLQVREGDNGRLTIVVRCGGGFLDFVAFVRRHGSIEDVKLQKRTDANGKQRVQLVSVLAQSKHIVRDEASPSRPGQMRSRSPAPQAAARPASPPLHTSRSSP